VFLDVHLGKGADVSNSRHVDGEVSEKVDNLRSPLPQGEVQDERSHQWTEHLVQDVHLIP
jgi:hypothetical protein